MGKGNGMCGGFVSACCLVAALVTGVPMVIGGIVLFELEEEINEHWDEYDLDHDIRLIYDLAVAMVTVGVLVIAGGLLLCLVAVFCGKKDVVDPNPKDQMIIIQTGQPPPVPMTGLPPPPPHTIQQDQTFPGY